MAGTVILTGANSSAGLHASEHILKKYPQHTAVFTVRSAADTDVNTNSLRAILARYPETKASIHELDLGDLTAVHNFATTISDGVAGGQYPPIKSIICNAYYWNLVSDPELTVDGFDKSIQIGHLSHVALILRLLGSFSPDGGRIELLSSIAHYRKKTGMSPYLPEIPDDLDLLIHPRADPDKQGRGFQRYGTLKLVITTWMYPLNEYLQKDPKLSKITVIAVNPGNLGDSRAFRTNTPASIRYAQKFVMRPFMSLVRRFADPTFRPSAEAGADIAELGVGRADDGQRGYYTLLEKDEPDPVVLDPENQRRIWAKSAEWAGITKDNTALKVAFE
ncbi:putative short-chain dehydrogenase [Durotheca rogersii]|uniref:putative short-chain dehydrogenase n=1 Tax=Durotheca rogersii TaxID=419775 RepID=UPI00221FEB81|nr:putative short-chain dehydrogenase [Durotheca rogersii]KAI5862349.1 putative short-chain dehydrogenase [Durotheca rogersii]